MTMRHRSVVVMGAVIAVGIAVAAPPAQATTVPAVRQVRSRASVTLATAGGVQTTVESLSLGKGAWTVASDVTAINFGSGDYVRCGLVSGGSAFDGGQTVYLANRVSGLNNVGTITLYAPATVSLRCDHDAAGSTHQFYIDPGATLTAAKGGPISAPGRPPVKGATVVEARSTASTTLNNTSPTAVTSVTLPTGTWALTANVSVVNFSGFDFDLCYLQNGAGSAVTTNDVQAGTESTDAIVTGLDAEATATVTARSAVLTLLCDSDFANTSYIDAGATVTATKVSTSTVRNTATLAHALPDGAGGSAVESRSTIPAGAWRVRSSIQIGNRYPNNSFGNGQDFVRCGLAANGRAIDGGATELVTMNSNIQVVVNAGSYTSTSPWTLTLTCSHDQQNSSGAHWTPIYGTVQAVNKGPIN